MPKTLPPLDHKIKVFIADDSLIVQEHLVTMLDELTEVEIVGQAGTVVGAISAIRKFQPDVVILDIRMPDGSGIDVLRTIKQDEPAPVTAVTVQKDTQRPGQQQRGAGYYRQRQNEDRPAIALVQQPRQVGTQHTAAVIS